MQLIEKPRLRFPYRDAEDKHSTGVLAGLGQPAGETFSACRLQLHQRADYVHQPCRLRFISIT